jgi:hypothetical protein
MGPKKCQIETRLISYRIIWKLATLFEEMTLIIRIKGDRKSGEVNWRQQYQVHGPFQHDYQY